MADFKTPNLCGANEQFNSLLSTFESLESDLLNGLETAASTLASTLGSGLDSIISDISSFGLPDLPDLPNINLQSQLTSLLSIDISSIDGLNQYNNLLTEITSAFGDSLTAAGFSLDSLISDASSLIGGGSGLCGSIPNFSLPSGGGAAKQIADAVGQASEKIETELPSAITTAKDILSTANSKLQANTEVAVAAAKKEIPLIVESINEGMGKISDNLAKFDRADAIIVANTSPWPALQKSLVEVKQLESYDGATGTSETITSNNVFLKNYQRRMNNIYNPAKESLAKLTSVIRRSMKKYPHNINEEGTKVYVSFPGGGGPESAEPSVFTGESSKYPLTWQGYYDYAEKMDIVLVNQGFKAMTDFAFAYQQAIAQDWIRVFKNGVATDKSSLESDMTALLDKYEPMFETLKELYDARTVEFKKTFINKLPESPEVVDISLNVPNLEQTRSSNARVLAIDPKLFSEGFAGNLLTREEYQKAVDENKYPNNTAFMKGIGSYSDYKKKRAREIRRLLANPGAG